MENVTENKLISDFENEAGKSIDACKAFILKAKKDEYNMFQKVKTGTFTLKYIDSPYYRNGSGKQNGKGFYISFYSVPGIVSEVKIGA